MPISLCPHMSSYAGKCCKHVHGPSTSVAHACAHMHAHPYPGTLVAGSVGITLGQDGSYPSPPLPLLSVLSPSVYLHQLVPFPSSPPLCESICLSVCSQPNSEQSILTQPCAPPLPRPPCRTQPPRQRLSSLALPRPLIGLPPCHPSISFLPPCAHPLSTLSGAHPSLPRQPCQPR